ncbi:hypothetical protein GXW82_39210 [Streptacidiphilus sp. 4-A2]|nr:hypothetical protein [Streptacidiphilus sp. 4-A2]
MSDHMISEDQLPEQLRADRDEAGAPYLVGLADGALRLSRRRQRIRAGLAGAAVVAVAAVGVTSSGLFGGAHAVAVGPAAGGSHAAVHAPAIALMPVISGKAGACPPGGGYPTYSDLPVTCFQLDKSAALDLTAPGAVAVLSSMTGQWQVELTLHGKDVPAFASLTGSSINSELAIVFDGKVLSSPTVDQRITDGQLPVFGNFTRGSATALADRMTGR